MTSENKLREWSEAILKILQEGSEDKMIENFAKYMDQKARMLE